MLSTASYPAALERSRSYPIAPAACPSDGLNSGLSACTLLPVSTLAERVAWILDNRRRPDGRAWSARGLSDAAGLAPAHVGMMKRGDAKDVRADTLAALAKAAGVSVRWLTTGDGAPDHDESAPSPTYTDDSTPVMENVEGYLAVEAEDRKAHPEVEDEFWLMGRRAGPLMIVGPAAPGDAYRLAKLAKDMRSPERLAWLLAERDRRIKALQGELEAERAKQHAAIAKKLAKQQGK